MAISIITPSYNQEKYIEKTIRSVIFQKGNFDIEYIIADGGSTDGTLKIIKRYDQLLESKKLAIRCRSVKIIWWSGKDKGQSSAINAGIKIAHGNILAYINSDDYYYPNAFAFVTDFFRKNSGLDMIYGDCQLIDSEGKKRQKLKSQKVNFDRLRSEGNFICQPSTFFNKRIFNELGMFREDIKYVFDYEMWLRIFKNKRKCVYSPHLFAAFRLHPHSKTVQDISLFWPEKRKVALQYGARLIDPIFLSRFEQKIKKVIDIKKINPDFYAFLRKTYHLIYDHYYKINI